LVLAALAFSATWARAGTYTWSASSTNDIPAIVAYGYTGSFYGPIYQNINPGSGPLIIDYDPTRDSFWTSMPVQTTGDQSFYKSDSFTFELDLNPPFFSDTQYGGYYNLVVTAPAPGQGLDSITFYGTLTARPGYNSDGMVTILAPNGTLSTSTVLPADLLAFESYALHDPGGNFSYTPGDAPTLPIYMGGVGGYLGVPEPSTVISMSIGMVLLVLVVLRRRPTSLR
jgi:hypothetical protein